MSNELTYIVNEKSGSQKNAPSGHDPRIVNLVKLLARISAKRDYSELIKHNNESLKEPKP